LKYGEICSNCFWKKGDPLPKPPTKEEIDATTQCKTCGSTSVRWCQQGDKWMLFSLTPGVLHACPIATNNFDPVEE
jgi:hypothetical protein